MACLAWGLGLALADGAAWAEGAGPLERPQSPPSTSPTMVDGNLELAQLATTPKQRNASTVRYSLPKQGEVTLGLYDQAGKLLRWITRADYRYAGDNRETWDGLDQWGQPIPAGNYIVKGIVHPPLKTDYRMSIGNPGSPPWPTQDGKGDWLSDEATPQAAATDGKWVFLAAPGSEKGWDIIAVDETGQRQWGLDEEFYPRAVSLAVDADYLYVLFSGPELTDSTMRHNREKKNAVERAVLMCVEKRTGKPARFTRENRRLKVAAWPYREALVDLATLRATHGFTPSVYGGQPRYFCNDLGESTGALGVAALNGRVYVSMHYEDKVLVLDAQTAQKLDEIPLRKPVGLHAANGALYAVSGAQVVRVDPAAKQATPMIADHLLAPHSLTTDSQGNLYVSDWSTSFQVKVFSAQGRFLRAIGKPGGRPWVGTWDKDGMLVPRGIAVTDDGKLWVAEDDGTPKRVSVWDARTGELLRDYIGPAPYGGGSTFWLDPEDPTVGYMMGTRFKIDWTRKAWTPLAVVFRKMSHDQPFVPNGHDCMAYGVRVLYHEGKEYLIVNDYHMLFVLRRKGEIYVPVAAAGGISRLVTDNGAGRTLWDSDVGYHLCRDFYPECFRGHAGDNFTWTDLNGDGLVQAEEMRWVRTLSRGDACAQERQPEWMTFKGAGIGPDWSLYFGGWCGEGGDHPKTISFRLDLQGRTPAGAPLYDIATAKPLFTNNRPASIGGYYVNAEGRLFVAYNHEYQHAYRKELPNALECRDRDGTLLWAIAMPRRRLRQDFHAENVIGEFQIPGVGNVLGTWLWHGNLRPYLLTSDGLYLGTLLEDTLLGPAALWGESFKYYFHTSDGTPHIVNGANDAHHLLAIRGLEQSVRFTFPLVVTEADVKAAAAMRAVPQVKTAPKPLIHIAWAATAPAIDGNLNDWNLDTGVTLRADASRGAQVALERDAENLYLACRVQDRTPLLNKGEDWQKLFTTGDCVDLMLAADLKADPHRRAAAAGDLRLLLGTFHEQPIAVLYRPVVPGTKEPAVFMAARIDEVRRLATARVAAVRGDGFYTVEAAVPLHDLGISLAECDSLKGDVGVVFSDQTGRGRVLRLYYYNKQTSMVSDLTTEATLQPVEWGPVQFPLGENLLRNGGFEEPFARSSDRGWRIEVESHGGVAKLTMDGPHSGKRALMLEQTTPVTFSEEAYALPRWEDFVKTANDGKGGGHVSLCQTVPVTAGNKYRFRMAYRTKDFQYEQRAAGRKDRGYIACSTAIFWVCPGKPAVATSIVCIRDSLDDWRVQLNATANGLTPDALTAPEGATRAIISFKFSTVAAGRLPRLWVDDVEFVQMDR